MDYPGARARIFAHPDDLILLQLRLSFWENLAQAYHSLHTKLISFYFNKIYLFDTLLRTRDNLCGPRLWSPHSTPTEFIFLAQLLCKRATIFAHPVKLILFKFIWLDYSAHVQRFFRTQLISFYSTKAHLSARTRCTRNMRCTPKSSQSTRPKFTFQVLVYLSARATIFAHLSNLMLL